MSRRCCASSIRLYIGSAASKPSQTLTARTLSTRRASHSRKSRNVIPFEVCFTSRSKIDALRLDSSSQRFHPYRV